MHPDQEDSSSSDLTPSPHPAPVPTGGSAANTEYGGLVEESRVGNETSSDNVFIEVASSQLGHVKFWGPVNLAPLMFAFLGVLIGAVIWAAFSAMPAGIVLMVVSVVIATAWQMNNQRRNRD